MRVMQVESGEMKTDGAKFGSTILVWIVKDFQRFSESDSSVLIGKKPFWCVHVLLHPNKFEKMSGRWIAVGEPFPGLEGCNLDQQTASVRTCQKTA